jgi:hypothetical protein
MHALPHRVRPPPAYAIALPALYSLGYREE